MKTDPEVEQFLAKATYPLLPLIRRVRELVLGADPRLTERMENGTVQFAFQGDLAAFVKLKEPRVSLMFYRGARIPGVYRHLEGDGPTARFMRFKDAAEVEARKAELERIVKAWCDLQAAAPVTRAKPEPEAEAKPAATKKSLRKGNPITQATHVAGKRVGGARSHSGPEKNRGAR